MNRRLELAELKHGRLAMAAVALHWATKLAGARGSAAAALAAGVPRGALTFAHQLWGEIRRDLLWSKPRDYFAGGGVIGVSSQLRP